MNVFDESVEQRIRREMHTHSLIQSTEKSEVLFYSSSKYSSRMFSWAVSSVGSLLWSFTNKHLYQRWMRILKQWYYWHVRLFLSRHIRSITARTESSLGKWSNMFDRNVMVDVASIIQYDLHTGCNNRCSRTNGRVWDSRIRRSEHHIQPDSWVDRTFFDETRHTCLTLMISSSEC